MVMEILVSALVLVSGYLLWRLYRVEGDLIKLSKRFDMLIEKLRENSVDVAPTRRTSVAPQPEVTEQQDDIAAREAPQTPEPKPLGKNPEVFGPPPPPPPPREPNALERLGPWLLQNWFYAISALSLALAGIFLVQYGIENGFLPPLARVMSALGFGAVLIGAGEVIRRRFGDDEDATTAYLPSVFSGAGIVSMFGAILSARLLYDLIGAEAALGGMVAVALVAMVLGWFYGPLLAAVGLLGAFGAPYVVGGESADPSWLFGYFSVLTVMGLGIDTIKRWTWVSVLTLVLAYVTGGLLGLNDGSVSLTFILYLTALPLLALTIPNRTLVPNHEGHMILDMLWLKDGFRMPYIPVLLLGGAMLASVVLLLGVTRGEAEVWLVLICLLVLSLTITLWGRHAPAIQDMAMIPVAGLLTFIMFIAVEYRNPVYAAFRRTYAETQEADFPFVVTLFLVIGAGLSLLAAWRAQEQGRLRLPFSFAAILVAPLMGIVLEMFWTPAEVIGAPVWALHAVALAALMVWFAASFARADGGAGLRTALAVLAALSIIAYALSIVLTFAALTVGLSAMIAVAAWLDNRFKLPQMSWFIMAGVAVVGYRLVADPGLAWGFERTALYEALLSYGGALLAAVAAWILIRRLDRPNTKAVLEAGATFFAAMLACVMIFRAIDALLVSSANSEHWSMGLYASVWFAAAFAQVYSMKDAKGLVLLRGIAATLFGLTGLIFIVAGATIFNPLFAGSYYGNQVQGPVVVNTLMPAYLLPAIILALGGIWVTNAARWLRGIWLVMVGVLGIMWVFAVIRHFWSVDGSIGLDTAMSQPELYTYTVVLLLSGAALFYQSLAKNHTLMRRAGLVVIGLAVAKVFLIDISGLQGLTRVFSLLVLGLSLAGLAWLNRWAQSRAEPETGHEQEALDPEE